MKLVFYTGCFIVAFVTLAAQATNDVERTSILIYDKLGMNRGAYPGGIDGLQNRVLETCQCQVQNLAGIGGFILRYQSANHIPADTFTTKDWQEAGIKSASEDAGGFTIFG